MYSKLTSVTNIGWPDADNKGQTGSSWRCCVLLLQPQGDTWLCRYEVRKKVGQRQTDHTARGPKQKICHTAAQSIGLATNAKLEPRYFYTNLTLLTAISMTRFKGRHGRLDREAKLDYYIKCMHAWLSKCHTYLAFWFTIYIFFCFFKILCVFVAIVIRDSEITAIGGIPI